MREPEDHRGAPLGRLANSDAVEIPDDCVSLSDSDPEDSGALYDAEVEDLSPGREGSPDGRDARDHPSAPTPPEPSFQLKGGSAGFSSRSQSIFHGLESAAKLSSPHLGEDNLIDGPFVRPMLPHGEKERGVAPSRNTLSSSSRGMPDYLAHPERWTRYSLEDVPDVSNSKNSLVAHEYIQGLQQRKVRSMVPSQEPFTPAFNQDHSSSSDGKILFSRPSRKGEGVAGDGLVVGGAGEAHAPEEARKKEVGLRHLDETEEEAKVVQSPASEAKRKFESDEGDKDSKVGFKSSRKVNRKHFRRVSEHEDD
ncbi:protein TSSC4 [Megalops cyprinoides]|uniref:protein TSSC4 n=1 Tax=Megalops cyprinoides TaxID=118141 RepID=UPI0018655CCF|nr:protein TSSC4 [Megalops cyprinoides]XP_036404178.1 protein TSSC4 [Megalops cyprinoides]XP_036404179.1 protein TSSC4 [Megalops cyprinoides]XP_036404180.1 protein TSSC4 [Megalops cyprinoides]XP_036404181.1 protein TSSC4 [Megalops cyprinoides]